MIFGERRPRMAVVVQLAEEQAELRATQKFGAVKEVVESERDSPMHAWESSWKVHGEPRTSPVSWHQQCTTILRRAFECHDMFYARVASGTRSFMLCRGCRTHGFGDCRGAFAEPARQQRQGCTATLRDLRLAPALQEKGYIQSKHLKDMKHRVSNKCVGVCVHGRGFATGGVGPGGHESRTCLPCKRSQSAWCCREAA